MCATACPAPKLAEPPEQALRRAAARGWHTRELDMIPGGNQPRPQRHSHHRCARLRHHQRSESGSQPAARGRHATLETVPVAILALLPKLPA